MQNVGFVYAMIIGLKKIHSENRGESIARHLQFFNTHPYLAPTVMGVDLKLEEEKQYDLIKQIQSTISGSLAAIGDIFFWSTLKPILSLLCIIAIMTDQIWGIILALAGYNLIHVWVMSWGFNQGYSRGPEAALGLGKIISTSRIQRIAYIIPFLCGMVMYLISSWNKTNMNLLTFLVLFVICLGAGKFKINIFWIFYGVFTLLLVWAIIR